MKRVDNMNVIPLIDVMLVLLAIVLLTASFIVHDKLDINLPQTQHTKSHKPEEKDAINMALDKDGQAYWQGEPIHLSQVKMELAQLEKDQLLQLKVDQKVEFQHFVSLIDLIKEQDHTNLTILTERLK